jgi:hypothetical protein
MECVIYHLATEPVHVDTFSKLTMVSSTVIEAIQRPSQLQSAQVFANGKRGGHADFILPCDHNLSCI